MFAVDTVAVVVDSLKVAADSAVVAADSVVATSCVIQTKEVLGAVGFGLFFAGVIVVIIYNKMRNKGFKVEAPK